MGDRAAHRSCVCFIDPVQRAHTIQDFLSYFNAGALYLFYVVLESLYKWLRICFNSFPNFIHSFPQKHCPANWL